MDEEPVAPESSDAILETDRIDDVSDDISGDVKVEPAVPACPVSNIKVDDVIEPCVILSTKLVDEASVKVNEEPVTPDSSDMTLEPR